MQHELLLALSCTSIATIIISISISIKKSQLLSMSLTHSSLAGAIPLRLSNMRRGASNSSSLARVVDARAQGASRSCIGGARQGTSCTSARAQASNGRVQEGRGLEEEAPPRLSALWQRGRKDLGLRLHDLRSGHTRWQQAAWLRQGL